MDYQTKIILDATKALKDLQKLEKALRNNDKTVNALNKNSQLLNKSLNNTARETGKLATQSKKLDDSMRKNTANTKKLNTQTNYLNDNLKKTTKNVSALNTQVKILSTATKSNTTAVKTLSASTKLLNTSTKNAATSMNRLNVSMKSNTTAIKNNTKQYTALSSSIRGLGTSINTVTTAMAKMGSQSAKNATLIKKNNDALIKTRNTMTALGTAVNKAAAGLATFSRNAMLMNKSLRSNTLALQKLSTQMFALGASIDRNTASILRYKTASNAAAVSQKRLGIAVGFVNKFLKIQLVMFRTAMLAATAYIGAKLYVEFNKTAESLDLMGRKLETFTKSSDSMTLVTASAFKTGFAIQDLGKIITRFAITTEGAFSTKTLARWTEGLVMSARAAGTSTMEMNNALIQLSQSFSAGFLMGDEYRSISENLPLFKLALRDVADEAGMAGQSLKELSSGRKIDIDLMTKALEKLSQESLKYTFALDNIEAAEQRLKIGWDLWANSVADSRTLKDSLNFLAGLLANIAQNGETMDVFADQFPKMNSAVIEVTSSLYNFYDTMTILQDEWVMFFSHASTDWSALGSTINDMATLSLKGWRELPITVNTIMSIIGVKIARSVEEWSLTFKILGVYWDKTMDYLSSSVDHFAADVKSTFLGIFDGIFESISSQFKGIATILSKFDTTSAMAKSFEDASKSLSGMIDKQKTYNQIEKDQKALYDEKVASSNAELKSLNDKIAAGKEITSQMTQEFLLQDAQDKKALDRKIALKKLTRDAERVAALTLSRASQKREEKNVDKGLPDRNLTNKKEVTAFENAVKKARKGLIRYSETYRDIANEIHQLKNPFDTQLDTTDDDRDLEDQLARLKALRDTNEISLKDYNAQVVKTRDLTKELIALKQDEHLNNLARSYDEVAAAQYEVAKTQTILNDLREAGKISEQAYTKAIYETTRALDIAKAKSGEMNEGDQFFKGMNDGLYDFANNNKTVFEEMSELTTKSFSSMTDELTEFVTTGKADFKGLVDSIVKDLTRIAIQKSITEPLAGALFGGGSSSGMIGGLTAGSTQSSMLNAQWAGSAPSSGGFLSGIGSLFTGLFSANGNAFSQGHQIQPFASGGVVSSPTLFPMADGAGLMGEAGAEAIMPLKRGRDGKLGVAATGDEQNITININVAGVKGDPEAMRRSAGQVALAASNALNRSQKRNG